MNDETAGTIPTKAATERRRRLSSPRGDFRYVKDLQLEDLPVGWQCPEALDVIGHVSQRVVMIYIPRMSSGRPESIYSDRPHYGGTGFAYYVDENIVKIRTNLHVIYNAEEASTAVVQFSLEVPGKRNTRVVRLRATAHDFHTNAREDYSSFTCRPSRYLAKYLHLFKAVPVLWDASSYCCGEAEVKDERKATAVGGGVDDRGLDVLRRFSNTAGKSREAAVVGAERLAADGPQRSSSAAEGTIVDGEGRFTEQAIVRRYSECPEGKRIVVTTEQGPVERTESCDAALFSRCLSEGRETRTAVERSFRPESKKRTESSVRVLQSIENLADSLNKHYLNSSIDPPAVAELSDQSGLNLENAPSAKRPEITSPSLQERKQLKLEYGDFVGILSHPQGSDKCFSVGRAALHDPKSFGGPRRPSERERSAHKECEENADTLLHHHEGTGVDLVNDRFRACRNRVYQTHTTFGCSGAPVLLFKRSLQHFKTPIVDYSQHSGTCFFRGGANLGFATCFIPPAFVAPCGTLRDAQQCYSLFRTEQSARRGSGDNRIVMGGSSSSISAEMFRTFSAQKHAPWSSDKYRQAMVHTIPTADFTETTHLVEHGSSTEDTTLYYYTVDQGTIVGTRILPETIHEYPSADFLQESLGLSISSVGSESNSPERTDYYPESFTSTGIENGGNGMTDHNLCTSCDGISPAFGCTENSPIPAHFVSPGDTQPGTERNSTYSLQQTPGVNDDPSQRFQPLISALSVEECGQRKSAERTTERRRNAGVCSLEGVIGNDGFLRNDPSFPEYLEPDTSVPTASWRLSPTICTDIPEEQASHSRRVEQGQDDSYQNSTTRLPSLMRPQEMSTSDDDAQSAVYYNTNTGMQGQSLPCLTQTEPNETTELSYFSAEKNSSSPSAYGSEAGENCILNEALDRSKVVGVPVSSQPNVAVPVCDLNEISGRKETSDVVMQNSMANGVQAVDKPSCDSALERAAMSANNLLAQTSNDNAKSTESCFSELTTTQHNTTLPTRRQDSVKPRLVTLPLVMTSKNEPSQDAQASPSQPGDQRVAWMTLTLNVRDKKEDAKSRTAGVLANERDWPALRVVSRLKSTHVRKGLELRRRRKSSARGDAGGASRSPITCAVRKKNMCTWRARKSKPLSHASLKKHLCSPSSPETISPTCDNENENRDNSVGPVEAEESPTPETTPSTTTTNGDQVEDKNQSSLFGTSCDVDAMLQISPATAKILPAQLSFDTFTALNNHPDLEQTPSRAECTSDSQHFEQSSSSCKEGQVYQQEQEKVQSRGEQKLFEHQREEFDAESLEFFSGMKQNSKVSGLLTEVVSTSSDSNPSNTPDVPTGDLPIDWVDEEYNDPNRSIAVEVAESVLAENSLENTASQSWDPLSGSDLALIYTDSDFDSLGDSLSAPRNSYTLHQLKVLKSTLDKTSKQTKTEEPVCRTPPNGTEDQDKRPDTDSCAVQSMLGIQEMVEEFSRRNTPKMNSERGKMREVTDIHRIENYCLELESKLLRHQRDTPGQQRPVLQKKPEEFRGMSDGVHHSLVPVCEQPGGQGINLGYFYRGDNSETHHVSNGVIVRAPNGEPPTHRSRHYSDIHGRFDRQNSPSGIALCQGEEGLSKDHLIQGRLPFPLPERNVCPVNASNRYRSKPYACPDPRVLKRCVEEQDCDVLKKIGFWTSQQRDTEVKRPTLLRRQPQGFADTPLYVSTTNPGYENTPHVAVASCFIQRNRQDDEKKQGSTKMAMTPTDNGQCSPSSHSLSAVGPGAHRSCPSIPSAPWSGDTKPVHVTRPFSCELPAQHQIVTGPYNSQQVNAGFLKVSRGIPASASKVNNAQAMPKQTTYVNQIENDCSEIERRFLRFKPDKQRPENQNKTVEGRTLLQDTKAEKDRANLSKSCGPLPHTATSINNRNNAMIQECAKNNLNQTITSAKGLDNETFRIRNNPTHQTHDRSFNTETYCNRFYDPLQIDTNYRQGNVPTASETYQPELSNVYSEHFQNVSQETYLAVDTLFRSAISYLNSGGNYANTGDLAGHNTFVPSPKYAGTKHLPSNARFKDRPETACDHWRSSLQSERWGSTPPGVGNVKPDYIQTLCAKLPESTDSRRSPEFRQTKQQRHFNSHSHQDQARADTRGGDFFEPSARRQFASKHVTEATKETDYPPSGYTPNNEVVMCQNEFGQFELEEAPSAPSSTDSSSYSSPVKNDCSRPDISGRTSPHFYLPNRGELAFHPSKNLHVHESECQDFHGMYIRAPEYQAYVNRPFTRKATKPPNGVQLQQALRRPAECPVERGRGNDCNYLGRWSSLERNADAVHANARTLGSGERVATSEPSAFDRFIGGVRFPDEEEVALPLSDTRCRESWAKETDRTADDPRFDAHNVRELNGGAQARQSATAYREGKGIQETRELGRRNDFHRREGSYTARTMTNNQRTDTGGITWMDRPALSLSSAFERFLDLTPEEEAEAVDTQNVRFAKSTRHPLPNQDVPVTSDSADGRPEDQLYDLNSVVGVVLEMGMVYIAGPPSSQELPANQRYAKQHDKESFLAVGGKRQFPGYQREKTAKEPDEPIYVEMANPSLGLSARRLARSHCIHHIDRSLEGPMDRTVYEATPDSRSAARRCGDGDDCFRPPARGRRHSNALDRASGSSSQSRCYQHGSGSLEDLPHVSRPSRPNLERDTKSAAVYIPDPNWIFANRIPDLPPKDDRALSRDRHGHEEKQGNQTTFKLNCLNCACTPSTPFSSGSEVFRFPSVNDAWQSYFSHHQHTSLGDSSSPWTRHCGAQGGSIFVENPLYRSDSQFHYPQSTSYYYSYYHHSPTMPSQHRSSPQGYYSQESCICGEVRREETSGEAWCYDHCYNYYFSQPVSDDQSTYNNKHPQTRRPSQTDWNPNNQHDLYTLPALPVPDSTRQDVTNRQSVILNSANGNDHTSNSDSHFSSRLHEQEFVEVEIHRGRQENGSDCAPLETACVDTADILDTSFLTTLHDLDIIQRFQSEGACSQSDDLTNMKRTTPEHNGGSPNNNTAAPERSNPGGKTHQGQTLVGNTALGNAADGNAVEGDLPQGKREQGNAPQGKTPGNTSGGNNQEGNAQDKIVQQGNPTERNLHQENTPDGNIHQRSLHQGNTLEGNADLGGIAPRRGIYTKNEKTKRTRNPKYIPKGKRGSGQDFNKCFMPKSPYRRGTSGSKGGTSGSKGGTSGSKGGGGRGEEKTGSSQQVDDISKPPTPSSSLSSSSSKGSKDEKAGSRTTHHRKWMETDGSSGREVCYVTVPTDIRQRLGKVAKWITTQVFGCPQVHTLTPTDAQTFHIQQNFNLTLQIMALKAQSKH